jgi:glutamate racemase
MHAKGIKIIEREGVGLVPLIEQGKIGSGETHNLLRRYLKPMLDEGIDYLVLGCTHYPYLVPVLKELLPGNVQIIDSGEAVARQTKAVLMKNELLNPSEKPGKHRFFTNVEPHVLEDFLKEDNDASYSVKQLDF